MHYVKVVTPLVLKRWVWPMIKCSHLTPKSIYSYIDDLVIANFLIDARFGCACFATYFNCHLIVWACWCIFYSFKDIHLLFWLFGSFFFRQVDGQECLRTFSSYLCFSCLKLYSCYITKFDQVRFEPLCVRSTRSPRFVTDLNFQIFFVCFGLTDSSISVIPRSLSRSRFLISVQLIWTFRLHRIAVTACSYSSRCHRVVPLGHTDRVRLYICTGQILEISPTSFARAQPALPPWVSGSSSSSPAASSRWSPSPSMEFYPAVAAIASLRRTRVWTRSLCYPQSDS